jgi:hypothetical protein
MVSNNKQDPLVAAKQAEREVNSYQAKQSLNNKSNLGLPPPHPLAQNQSRSSMPATNTLPTANESGINEQSSQSPRFQSLAIFNSSLKFLTSHFNFK